MFKVFQKFIKVPMAMQVEKIINYYSFKVYTKYLTNFHVVYIRVTQ